MRLPAAHRLLALCVALACAPVAGATEFITINANALYPEQAAWRDGSLYYPEMGGDRVSRWDGATNVPFWTRSGCGPTSVQRGPRDTIFVLCHLADAVALVDAKGETAKVFSRDDAGRTFPYPNGSASDGRGGLFFSSSGIFSDRAPATGALLHITAEGRVERLADGIRYANGVALSPDGRHVFVSEHLNRAVLRFDLDSKGALSGRKVFARLNDMVPAPQRESWWVGADGLLADAKGNLFIAEYGGGRVIAVDRNGKHLATIDLPEKFVTAASFGETEDFLFVTVPASLMDPRAPGKVFKVRNPLLP